MIPVFITGIGTDVGKSLVAAIVCKALGAAYWKPVQAGSLENTDSHLVSTLAGNATLIEQESYRLAMAASPHIAAREEGLNINLRKIETDFHSIVSKADSEYLVIEGAGGLLVPLNEKDTVADLIILLQAPVLLVSRNYLGSFNHSLLTAATCRHLNIKMAGWIFTDEYMHYENEIALRSGLPTLAKIPFLDKINAEVVAEIATGIRQSLSRALKGTL